MFVISHLEGVDATRPPHSEFAAVSSQLSLSSLVTSALASGLSEKSRKMRCRGWTGNHHGISVVQRLCPRHAPSPLLSAASCKAAIWSNWRIPSDNHRFSLLQSWFVWYGVSRAIEATRQTSVEIPSGLCLWRSCQRWMILKSFRRLGCLREQK